MLWGHRKRLGLVVLVHSPSCSSTWGSAARYMSEDTSRWLLPPSMSDSQALNSPRKKSFMPCLEDIRIYSVWSEAVGQPFLYFKGGTQGRMWEEASPWNTNRRQRGAKEKPGHWWHHLICYINPCWELDLALDFSKPLIMWTSFNWIFCGLQQKLS